MAVMKKSIVISNPNIMGGTPVFAGTRVPVKTLFDYLSAGDSINEFLDGFPTVKKSSVVSILAKAKEKFIKKTA